MEEEEEVRPLITTVAAEEDQATLAVAWTIAILFQDRVGLQ